MANGQWHLKRWQLWQQEEEKEKGKEKHRSKEEQKGQGQKGREQGKKGQEKISLPYRTCTRHLQTKGEIMPLCVDFLAAVMSLDRTQEQKDHYKSKRVMCAGSTYLQRSTFLPWFCMSISWGQRGSNTASYMVSHQWILPNVSSNIVPYIWR